MPILTILDRDKSTAVTERALSRERHPSRLPAKEPEKKPLILLDVDGVVNAWPLRGANRDHEYFTVEGYLVRVHSETLQALILLSEAVGEMLWCTAWRHKANGIGARLNIMSGGRFPAEMGVISDVDRSQLNDPLIDFTTEWKLGSVLEDERVQAAFTEGRPVVWIEDHDFRFDRKAQAEIEGHGIVTVDTAREGRLTKRHLTEAGLI